MIKLFQSIFGRSHTAGLVPLTPKLSKIPRKVRDMMCLYDSWIVGGAARYVVGLSNETPKDYDFVIPKAEDVARFKKDIEKRNTTDPEYNFETFNYTFEPQTTHTEMGGHRIAITDKLTLDVWFDDVATYVTEVPTVWDGLAIRLSSRAVIVSGELAQEIRNRLIENRDIRRHTDPERFAEHLTHQGLGE